ncbi:MAG: hypothetical protein KKB85_02545 [Candidatus Altiarchaeota archaeon]|nr:hypothetical protein [Candidatus Altiarchaeota archaeon]
MRGTSSSNFARNWAFSMLWMNRVKPSGPHTARPPRFIHNIEKAQFRAKFEDDVPRMEGNTGIGVISDFEDQPLIIGSHLGTYAIVTVGVFRNTELIYNNRLASLAEEMGYKGVLAEGADHILGWRSPNFLYKPVTAKRIRLLLKNYRLSDDIAFRFSERSWEGWPLTAEKFANWISKINGNGNCVNLFMDYETFGEHQWESTGIFDFLRRLPAEILKHPDNEFMTPSEVVREFKPVAELDVHNVVSWADVERDLSAWLGNPMQMSAIECLYRLEDSVKESGDEKLLEDWRRLQTADHFYYMCTKWFNDGDVHKYFNVYERPHDSFIAFMNVLNDMGIRLKIHKNWREKNGKEKNNEGKKECEEIFGGRYSRELLLGQ